MTEEELLEAAAALRVKYNAGTATADEVRELRNIYLILADSVEFDRQTA